VLACSGLEAYFPYKNEDVGRAPYAAMRSTKGIAILSARRFD
jgi:hypothetical protein